MTQKTTDAAPFIQALSFAFYALHDQLVDHGALPPSRVANALRAFRPGDDPEGQTTAAILLAMAGQLDAHNWGVAGSERKLDVIEGGKS